MPEGIGDQFQKETKYVRGKLPGGHLRWLKKPEKYKTYPAAPKVKLDIPQKEGGMPIWQAVKARRSVRSFQDKPLKKSDLSQILWASQGITQKTMGYELRSVPSAGALYPVEIYLIIRNVEGIEPGIYHYDILSHELEVLRQGNFGEQAAEASLDQGFMAEAGVIFAWTAVFARSKWKYLERAYRYVYLDAGHIAQNVAIAAVALDLASCQIAALYDDEVNALLGVDGNEESIIYMTVVGHPR